MKKNKLFLFAVIKIQKFFKKYLKKLQAQRAYMSKILRIQWGIRKFLKIIQRRKMNKKYFNAVLIIGFWAKKWSLKRKKAAIKLQNFFKKKCARFYTKI